MNTPKDNLDQMPPAEANEWFQDVQRERRKDVFLRALEYYERARANGLEDAETERCQLFQAIEALGESSEAQASYFAERKATQKTAALKKIEQNLEEGRRKHQEAVKKAFTQGKVTDAVRKYHKDRHQERLEGIQKAHANSDPLPELVVETRDERIVNDQLRSFGSVVKIDTGNIQHRLRRPNSNE